MFCFKLHSLIKYKLNTLNVMCVYGHSKYKSVLHFLFKLCTFNYVFGKYFC